MADKRRLSRGSLWGYLRGHSYVTVPQIRWRFGLLDADEVTSISCSAGTCYVGLPERAAHLLQELWQEGKVGFEWAADLNAPLVLGAFTLRSATGSRAIEPDGEEERAPVVASPRLAF